jgi:D-sedoheptulose 7-phosphate isomerase
MASMARGPRGQERERSRVSTLGTTRSTIERWLEQRRGASAAFFPASADRLARLCHLLSERFLEGGRLLAFGLSPQARTDVRHVAVEFVHPVIVGKRALPAIGLTESSELSLLAEPADIVMAFGEPSDGPELAAGIETARVRGCLTVAFAGLGAEWIFEPPSQNRFVRQELVETTYHVLWELVHVFFEHEGRQTEAGGAASFLYPFLAEGCADPEAVIADVRESVLMKADEVQALRERTVEEGETSLAAAAASIRAVFARGGRLLALGNGGSATDAMDLVADLVSAGRPAIDLTADSAIITAVANDIGPEAIFARQVIAYGRPGDVLVALSTSGNSPSMTSALAEARRREVETVALVGYDGGHVAADALADHVVISPSQHIPRIQEAQATAYHLLLEMAVAEDESGDDGQPGL